MVELYRTHVKMAENLTGKIIGDKGYISQKLFDQLYEKGLQLITKIRKNMKNKLVLMCSGQVILDTFN
ncbi:Transposase DDE domain protein [Piscirickettsia salmonis]|uniref:transposase n=1 Tax=Piscirickettsia salmonis TaxID=1238 RepID=UPI00056AE6BB|nr:hypothetical protein AWJ11_06960 [Piscirickettsia salmonis]AOS34610.1 hypothetical protein AVM72_04130 [Piscirickettsia salmonis]APS59325.1 hypothetical protein AVI53_01050 [Piscirickettsia salmonis]APS62552.1 hypothetical protein AVI54_01045 [Piscirickettsia salmonis]APS66313.1 hypothetical protein AVI55_04125 [Piscirickettsia salmonis]